MTTMRVALAQMTSGIDPAANADALVAAIAEAGRADADMLFTPEMSGLLDRDRRRASAKLRDEASDPVLAAVREAAAKAGVWVQLGSLALAGERADGRLVNRAFLIDAEGTIRARYDKIHLFDVDLATGESWRESAVYAPGSAPMLASTPWGAIGLTICYDLRFSDLYRSLTDAGAVILTVPAAFTVPTGEAHWHLLLRARAVEAGVFVIAAAQSGTHEDGRATYGHSLVVDPWGEVLLDMGEGAGVATVDIDLARVSEVRGRVPAISHRRPLPPPVVAA
jgi:predicted amidohydrolase